MPCLQTQDVRRAAAASRWRPMSDAVPPEPTPRDPLQQRVEALLLLRDELQALNARLEYVALMLRLTGPARPQ